ncbi:cytochrome c [Saprospiraceae bacterium]|nr:cytochrome c [Saprospiraceae bacterium]
MKRLISITFLSALFLFIACDHNIYKQGKDLYESNCAACHMPDGSGVGDLYPALSTLGPNYNYSHISCFVVNGKKSENSVLEMVAIKGLSDVQISNIINYVRSEMNQLEGEVSIAQIREQLTDCTE